MWTRDGTLLTDENMAQNVGELSPAELLQLSESEWREIFRNDGTDFLLDQHTPRTRRALHSLMQSQILRAVLEEDGPARRTRSASRRLRLGADEDRQEGAHDNEAGPNGTSMDTD